MKTALIVCYGGGHVAACLPVAELLQRRGWCIRFLALTTAAKYLKDRGWSYLSFSDFITPEDASALQIGESLLANSINSAIPKSESVAYLGMSYQELIEAHGVDKAKELYDKIGRQAFLPIKFLCRVITRIAPDVIFTTCSPRAEHAAIIAGIQQKVPTACFLDLPDRVMAQRTAKIQGISRIFAFDERSRRLLLEHGASESIIQVSGNPAFDCLHSSDAVDKAERLLAGLRACGKTKVIVWASQIEPSKHPTTGQIGDPFLPHRIETALREWVKTRTDTALFVRYHPNDSTPFALGENVFHSNSTDSLAVLLNASDVVVTMTSTVALEAKALGKQVITIDLSIFTPDMPLAEMGISIGITDLAKIPETLEYSIQAARDQAQKFSYFEAAPSIADAIESLLPRN